MTPLAEAVPAAHAEEAGQSADRSADWPAASLDAVRAAGILGWSIPAEFVGGDVADDADTGGALAGR